MAKKKHKHKQKPSPRFIRTTLVYYTKDGSGIYSKAGYHKSYANQSVKFFFNWQHLLVKNSPITISLMFYLAETMHKATNEVAHSLATIRNYIKFRQSSGIKACSVSAVRKGFAELHKNSILISTPETGTYIINPILMYRESEVCRRTYINLLLECTKDASWQRTNLFEALRIY